MRYHHEKPSIYLSKYGITYECDHPVYNKCTLFNIGDKGLAIIQQRYDTNTKATWWSEIEPWLTDCLYLHPRFKQYFDMRAGEPIDGIYPTISIRQVMWALKMKPLKRERWEHILIGREFKYALITMHIMKEEIKMNEDKKLLCEVYYHFENVPIYARERMKKEFMKNRGVIVEIFNMLINEVNKEWNLTGEQASLGDYIEDINPKYNKLVQTRIQPAIDIANKLFPYCEYKIDEYCDIVGYIPKYKNSKLWIDFKIIEP